MMIGPRVQFMNSSTGSNPLVIQFWFENWIIGLGHLCANIARKSYKKANLEDIDGFMYVKPWS